MNHNRVVIIVNSKRGGREAELKLEEPLKTPKQKSKANNRCVIRGDR